MPTPPVGAGAGFDDIGGDGCEAGGVLPGEPVVAFAGVDGVAGFVPDPVPADAVPDDEVDDGVDDGTDGVAVEAEAAEGAEWCVEEQPASAAATRIAAPVVAVTRFRPAFGEVRVRARAFMALAPLVGVRYRRSWVGRYRGRIGSADPLAEQPTPPASRSGARRHAQLSAPTSRRSPTAVHRSTGRFLISAGSPAGCAA